MDEVIEDGKQEKYKGNIQEDSCNENFARDWEAISGKNKKNREDVTMPAKNQDCDKCGGHFTKSGSVRRLDTGGGGGAYLCRGCWKKEMKWRAMRNKSLTGAARFSVKKFPE